MSVDAQVLRSTLCKTEETYKVKKNCKDVSRITSHVEKV